MGYFLATIFFIGFPICVATLIPLYFLSFFVPSVQKPADRILLWGIALLMRVQPWFNSEITIEIPPGGAMLVSNHRSHLDAFVFLSNVRGVRILAKKTLFYVPLLGIMMKVTGQIPTQRGRLDSFWLAMQEIRKKLQAGETVHVFPEMTRCEPGFKGTQNFIAAPFLVAKEVGTPVIPVVIEGTDQAWPRGKFGLRPYRPIRVRTLPAIDPKDFASADALCLETKKRITEALQWS
jgi:1-acyl-sn-glycerol-3-phosphate acyltransferase